MALVEQNGCRAATLGLAVCLLAMLTGCQPFDHYTRPLQAPVPTELEPPTELRMVSLPAYRVAPPDILQIEALRLVPRQPYHIEIYDVLSIKAAFALPDEPINGLYVVDDDGNLDLGPTYGKTRVLGLTLPEAQKMISKKLEAVLRQPEITVELARMGATQQVNGVYLVQPGGVINLRQYGAVHVAGKTLVEVREAVEKQLAQFFDSPQAAVTVTGFNSEKYYIIFAGERGGEDVVSLPITGKETVLDAIGALGGLNHVSTNELWISRPDPANNGCEQVLPIDYVAITRGGATATNYQLMPGDRIYIVEDGAVGLGAFVSKVSSPLGQLLSITELGTSTMQRAATLGRNYNRLRRAF
jgi:polysaccharide export outer membrane protein